MTHMKKTSAKMTEADVNSYPFTHVRGRSAMLEMARRVWAREMIVLLNTFMSAMTETVVRLQRNVLVTQILENANLGEDVLSAQNVEHIFTETLERVMSDGIWQVIYQIRTAGESTAQDERVSNMFRGIGVLKVCFSATVLQCFCIFCVFCTHTSWGFWRVR